MRTRSEHLFEELCRLHSIGFEPVPRAGVETPDYTVTIGIQEVVVEIKQIDPNREERDADLRVQRGELVALSGEPGHRVRGKISEGNSQIRSRTKGALPSMLVLFNNVPVRRHTTADQIRMAMYGVELVGILPSSPHDVIVKLGPKKKMTEEHNTSISVIGVIDLVAVDGEKIPILTVYHNCHAKVPLDPELLRDAGIEQFALEPFEDRKSQQWVRL